MDLGYLRKQKIRLRWAMMLCWISVLSSWKSCLEKVEYPRSEAQPQRKDINILHAKFGPPLEALTHATGRVIGLNCTGMVKPCEDCAWERQKRVT